jgi:hypothetical protein
VKLQILTLPTSEGPSSGMMRLVVWGVWKFSKVSELFAAPIITATALYLTQNVFSIKILIAVMWMQQRALKRSSDAIRQHGATTQNSQIHIECHRLMLDVRRHVSDPDIVMRQINNRIVLNLFRTVCQV